MELTETYVVTTCLLLIVGHQVVKAEYEGCISEKYYRYSSEHTACVKKSADATNSGVSENDKTIIVDRHNTLRSQQQNAANMQKMVWDDELAAVAQRWTDNCKWAHDKIRDIPGSYSAGQNLAAGTNNWSGVVDGWYAEIRQFTYGSQPANNFNNVAHYTQVVWATSSRVGCGYTYCKNMRYNAFYACNYGPAGNNGDWSVPFRKSRTCGDCPRSCRNNLCDCGGKVCKNGGTLDLNTCECTCAKPWNIPGDCSLNCTAVNEDRACLSGGFYDGKCFQWTNVPSECPVTCNVCPYAGVGYEEKTSGGGADIAALNIFLLCISVLIQIIYFSRN